MRISVYFGIFLTFAFYSIYTILVATWCTPDMGQSWTNFLLNPDVQARCRKSNDLAVVQSGFSIASDFYLLLLPVPVMRYLNLRSIAKLGVTLIFAIGLMACTAAITGLYFRIHSRDNGDFTWQIVPAQAAMVYE